MIYLVTLMSLLCFPVWASVEAMKEQLDQIEKESFAFVDLELTQEEQGVLEKLKIKDAHRYDQFGNLHLMKENLPAFFKEIGNDDEELVASTAKIIAKTVQKVLEASGKNSAWVSIRAHVPSGENAMLRWHMDGSDYGLNTLGLYPKPTWKFVTTLKGPSTLMYDLPADVRETFIAHFNDQEFLNQLLDLNRVQRANPGQGTFFVIGDKARGAIHSEPSLQEGRLFLSIVAGSEAEIDELYRRRRAQTVESGTWEEESTRWTKEEREAYERERAAYEAKERAMEKQTPLLGEKIVSLEETYTIIKHLGDNAGEKVYVAKASTGVLYKLRWWHGVCPPWLIEEGLKKNKEKRYTFGQLFDHPYIIKSIETFVDKKKRSFDVFEFPEENHLADTPLTEAEAIVLSKQFLSIVRYIASSKYTLNPHLSDFVINENKDLILYELARINDPDPRGVSTSLCLNYINICLDILSKADISFESVLSYKAKMMKWFWLMEAEVKSGKSYSRNKFLDQIEAALDN